MQEDSLKWGLGSAVATAASMKAVARLHLWTRNPTRLKRKNQLVHFASPN